MVASAGACVSICYREGRDFGCATSRIHKESLWRTEGIFCAQNSFAASFLCHGSRARSVSSHGAIRRSEWLSGSHASHLFLRHRRGCVRNFCRSDELGEVREDLAPAPARSPPSAPARLPRRTCHRPAATGCSSAAITLPAQRSQRPRAVSVTTSRRADRRRATVLDVQRRATCSRAAPAAGGCILSKYAIMIIIIGGMIKQAPKFIETYQCKRR